MGLREGCSPKALERAHNRGEILTGDFLIHSSVSLPHKTVESYYATPLLNNQKPKILFEMWQRMTKPHI